MLSGRAGALLRQVRRHRDLSQEELARRGGVSTTSRSRNVGETTVKRSIGGEWNDGLAPDFVDFVVSLNRHQVDCVLVGAYALAVYGVVRATADIDFPYRREADNVRR